jgi:hypothetical protein
MYCLLPPIPAFALPIHFPSCYVSWEVRETAGGKRGFQQQQRVGLQMIQSDRNRSNLEQQKDKRGLLSIINIL